MGTFKIRSIGHAQKTTINGTDFRLCISDCLRGGDHVLSCNRRMEKGPPVSSNSPWKTVCWGLFMTIILGKVIAPDNKDTMQMFKIPGGRSGSNYMRDVLTPGYVTLCYEQCWAPTWIRLPIALWWWDIEGTMAVFSVICFLFKIKK